jgi:uncharacterized protein involved in exopolysaccharide biosynthesis
MLGEIAAIVSALRGVQSVLAQIKDAKATYDQASQMLGKLGNAQDLLDKREKKLKLRKPLTAKQSLEIVQKQAEISAAKQKVRDHLLMSGHGDMLKKQERLMMESRAAHTAWMKGVAHRRKERRQAMRVLASGSFIIVAVCILVGAGFFFRQVYLDESLKSKKQILMEKRERNRNYRACGRPKC